MKNIMRYLYVLLILVMAGCTYPKDPENSWEKAKVTGLKVGISENPPYTTWDNGKAGGMEVDMLRKFAKSENLKIKFEKGSESDLVEKMEKYELHVIAGGFTRKTIWKKKAGPTAPYDKNHVFLVPKGENRLLQHLETFIFHKIKNK